MFEDSYKWECPKCGEVLEGDPGALHEQLGVPLYRWSNRGVVKMKQRAENYLRFWD